MRGQTFRFSMPRTLCNSQGACTILAGQVGTMFTDGKIATPASGKTVLVLSPYITARERKTHETHRYLHPPHLNIRFY
jgi:hypothetical protein